MSIEQPEKSYRQLIAFQRADNLVASIYQISKSFPMEEELGLVVQIRRSAYLIPVSIAEGFSRATRPGFAQGILLATRSLTELEYFVDLSLRLGYITTDMHLRLSQEIAYTSRSLRGLLKSFELEEQQGLYRIGPRLGNKMKEAMVYYALAG